MAIKKFSDLPISDLEKPIQTPTISPESTESGNNDEFFEKDNPKIDTPYTDPSIDEEMKALQRLKESQLSVSSSEAIKHLAGTKTAVIYYRQIELKVDRDTINVTSGTDPENKTRYARYDNMIVNTDGELNSAFEVDDGVVKNEITASALVYPGFKPLPNDLFYANEKFGKGVLYKVINVEPIAAFDDTGFRIEYQRHYTQFDPAQMANKVDEYWVFNFDAVGKSVDGAGVVLERKIYNVYRKVKETFKAVSEEYLDRFFDKNKNVIRWHYRLEPPDPDYKNLGNLGYEPPCPPRYQDIFDPYVMAFFEKTELHSALTYKNYSVFPISPFHENDEFEKIYKMSVFYAIKARKPNLIKEIYTVTKPFLTISLREQAWRGWYYFDITRNLEDPDHIKVYPDRLIPKIVKNDLYTKEHDDLDLLKYNLIIKFMNNKDYYPSEEELQVFIDEVELIPDDELFGVAPLLLYICNYYSESILRKGY